jgi:hypothetical protein
MKNLMLALRSRRWARTAVPAPYSYYPEHAYYYPAPSVSVGGGVYAGPGHYRHRYYGRNRWYMLALE